MSIRTACLLIRYAFSPPDVIGRRMPVLVAGVLASLAELELEFGRERHAAAREARRARGQAIGRPKVLNASKAALAQRMHASGESASTVASTLKVSRATVYRVLAELIDDGD
jgi:DNA invertase Pin-like site-specific DNA recombinase